MVCLMTGRLYGRSLKISKRRQESYNFITPIGALAFDKMTYAVVIACLKYCIFKINPIFIESIKIGEYCVSLFFNRKLIKGLNKKTLYKIKLLKFV